MIRIAAAGDVHFGTDSAETLRPHLEHITERADMFLIAGDLTRCGGEDEGRVLSDELKDLDLPVISVLGNHDYQLDQPERIRDVMEAGGVRVLMDDSEIVDVNGTTVGVVGVKGFGGGFAGACGSDFGEPEMKAFIAHTKAISDRLRDLLETSEADVRVALLHYSPVEETLRGERLEIYPFLGSYLLAEAIDAAGADLVLHGHAHNGTEKGITPGGVPVRNVAQPVLRRAYATYEIEASSFVSGERGVPVASERR
jgi:Icc-related predicted phosphoesterase